MSQLGMLLSVEMSRGAVVVRRGRQAISCRFCADSGPILARILARILPFGTTREIATYAIDPLEFVFLRGGVTHGVVAIMTLRVANGFLDAVRPRWRRYPRMTT